MKDELLKLINEKVSVLRNTIAESKPEIKVCITIPAKNEEHYLLQTLDALVHQKDSHGNRLSYNLFEVIVLCHNCQDGTYALASDFKQFQPEFNLHILRLNSNEINNIGAARRVLMNISAERLCKDDAWIAMTDADTVPSSDWVNRILNLDQTVDMVCGRIKVNTKGLSPEVIHLLAAKQEYNQLKTQLKSLIVKDTTDPWPKHNNHSGPNMALRKHIYLSVDGIPPIDFLEDIALFKRVSAAGFNIRHLNELEVETSGRLYSKTECGLGSELKKWSNHKVTYRVENLQALHIRFEVYNMIQSLFSKYDHQLLMDISRMSLIPKNRIEEIYKQSAIKEQMMLKIEEELDTHLLWENQYPIQDIYKVNKELSTYLNDIKVPAFSKE